MGKYDASETTLADIHINGTGPGRTVIRVVSWNKRPPVLEKRQIIIDDKTREERSGKNKGLTAAEVEMVVDRWPEIRDLFIQHDPTYTPRPTDGKRKVR